MSSFNLSGARKKKSSDMASISFMIFKSFDLRLSAMEPNKVVGLVRETTGLEKNWFKNISNLEHVG